MRQNLSNIRIRGTVYHYRRRVPPKLVPILGQTEIIRSLETSSAREARRRASAMNFETDRAFKQMNGMSLAQEQVATIVRRLKSEPFWDAPTRQEILSDYANGDRWTVDRLFGLGESHIVALPEEERQKVTMHLRRLLEGVEQHISIRRAEVAEARVENAEIASLLASLKGEEGIGWGLKICEERLSRVEASGVSPSAKISPRFSEKTEEFLAHKMTAGDDGRAYSRQTVAQTRVTFKLWGELIGDKCVRDYTREEVGQFRQQLLELPASHGKSTARISAKEAIARRKLVADNSKTLTQKTAKRHFSALAQYWKWLRARGHVDDIIFSGFEFGGAKSSRRRRDDWSPEDLTRLISHAPWFGDHADRNSAFYWLPLIAMHGGMRVEEIARLRPALDIDVVDGVPVFRIQQHQDGWSPKSEAGERLVPVHSQLIALGFLDFVSMRRENKSVRLFTDLVAGGPDGKLSYSFSREFSRTKKHKLKISDRTTFHSFRASARTQLTDVGPDLIRDSWIDFLLGHESNAAQGEGVRTYLKRIEVQRLSQVVEAIRPPVDLSSLTRWTHP